jgi:hypothetical protein
MQARRWPKPVAHPAAAHSAAVHLEVALQPEARRVATFLHLAAGRPRQEAFREPPMARVLARSLTGVRAAVAAEEWAMRPEGQPKAPAPVGAQPAAAGEAQQAVSVVTEQPQGVAEARQPVAALASAAQPRAEVGAVSAAAAQPSAVEVPDAPPEVEAEVEPQPVVQDAAVAVPQPEAALVEGERRQEGVLGAAAVRPWVVPSAFHPRRARLAPSPSAPAALEQTAAPIARS